MARPAYDPISKPHRFLLGAVLVCVAVLMMAMMARAIELNAPKGTVIEEEDEEPRSSLPTAPGRFK
jgi:hypothetical protein